MAKKENMGSKISTSFALCRNINGVLWKSLEDYFRYSGWEKSLWGSDIWVVTWKVRGSKLEQVRKRLQTKETFITRVWDRRESGMFQDLTEGQKTSLFLSLPTNFCHGNSTINTVKTKFRFGETYTWAFVFYKCMNSSWTVFYSVCKHIRHAYCLFSLAFILRDI